MGRSRAMAEKLLVHQLEEVHGLLVRTKLKSESLELREVID